MLYESSLIRKIGAVGLAAVKAVRIGIAGAGGLGSNCAAFLVRSGFQRLRIVDFDVVETANLDRQFYFADQVGRPKVMALRENLLRINPHLMIETKILRIESATAGRIFADCPIVAECLDHAEVKSMLVSSLLPTGRFIVAASGLGGYGESDEIRVHRIRANLTLIGDLQSDIALKPALAPRVGIVAAKQADVILEHVLHATGYKFPVEY